MQGCVLQNTVSNRPACKSHAPQKGAPHLEGMMEGDGCVAQQPAVVLSAHTCKQPHACVSLLMLCLILGICMRAGMRRRSRERRRPLLTCAPEPGERRGVDGGRVSSACSGSGEGGSVMHLKATSAQAPRAPTTPIHLLGCPRNKPVNEEGSTVANEIIWARNVLGWVTWATPQGLCQALYALKSQVRPKTACAQVNRVAGASGPPWAIRAIQTACMHA